MAVKMAEPERDSLIESAAASLCKQQGRATHDFLGEPTNALHEARRAVADYLDVMPKASAKPPAGHGTEVENGN